MSLTISILFSGLFVFKEIYICPSSVTSRKPKQTITSTRLIESTFQHLFHAESGRISFCTMHLIFYVCRLHCLLCNYSRCMDCHQKIKLALAADMLLAQQVVVVALMILLMFDCDCQQAEAEKAKAAAPPPGVNLSTNNRTNNKIHQHQVLPYQITIKLTTKSSSTSTRSTSGHCQCGCSPSPGG